MLSSIVNKKEGQLLSINLDEQWIIVVYLLVNVFIFYTN